MYKLKVQRKRAMAQAEGAEYAIVAEGLAANPLIKAINSE